MSSQVFTHRLFRVLFLITALTALGCQRQECPTTPEESCPDSITASPPDTSPAVATESIPLIGVSGYVVMPGTRGDDGLGNYRMTRTYRDAVVAAGGQVVHLVPVPADRVGSLLDRLDGLILAGGPDVDPQAYGEEQHPTVSVVPEERQEFDFALAREAMRRRMPILGICLGSQELNVVLGGSLVQDIPSEVEENVGHRRLDLEELRSGVHEITFIADTRLAGLYERSTITVNSAHHQASDDLGEGLVVAARAADGIVEAYELPGYPFLIGVQFHPEIQNAPAGQHSGLFGALVEAAVEYRRGR